MPNLSPQETLDRLRDAVRYGLRAFSRAEQDYPYTGNADLDRVGLLAFQVGALHGTLSEVAGLLGVEFPGGAS